MFKRACHECRGGMIALKDMADGTEGIVLCTHCRGSGYEPKLTFNEKVLIGLLFVVGVDLLVLCLFLLTLGYFHRELMS